MKILGLILTLSGAIALILDILDAFRNIGFGFSPWVLIILGIVFFFADIGLLKQQKDTGVNPS
ncbi:MAG: hypothetical protein CVU03_08870 [Bacteroidetes bacterium HGW-Bacteroidetes-2]|nr:MAG: hypothetical protein CVU03_08870 [Bacteroidetes bacterium HGW-Bacteroidetes-2]